MKIQILKFKRNRLFRKLGRRIAEEHAADSSVAAEAGEVKAASEKLRSVDAEIQALATQTYVWARRPLLTGSVVLALAIIFAGVAYEQEVATPDTSTPKKAAIAFYDALSANQMKLARSLAIGPESALTTVKLACDIDAAMSRYRGAEAKKFGNAATAEKPLREELESAQEKIEGDTAQVDPWHLRKVDGRWEIDFSGAQDITATEANVFARETKERIQFLNKLADDIERGRYKTREESSAEFVKILDVVQQQASAEKKETGSTAQSSKNSNADANAKAEALARAEQQTKQDVRKVAQAFVEALERNDMRSASSLASGDEKQLALAKAQHDFARSFARMQLARAKKFGGDQASIFFDPSWSKAEEQIKGDKATVKNGMIGYQLQKSGQTWKVNLPESSGSDLLSVASSLTHDIDEIARKVEKGDYKNDKEAEDAFEARLAAVTAAQTSRLRSEDSLAFERYLRSRLVGGMTERQIVEISDLIAEKFASPEVSQIREHCFKGTGDQRQYDPKGEWEVPAAAAEPQVKRLWEEIEQMYPPRAVFASKDVWKKAKALSPIEEPIQQGPKPPGSLVDEHLESFEYAMVHLADAYKSQRYYTGKSRYSYYNDVKSLQAGDVLSCRYESGKNFFHERPYFFWYRETPPGLEDLLRTVPKDHPIHQIGPPLEEAPPTLDLAMKANVATAEDVKKMMAESRARAQEAPTPKGTSYERGRDLILKAVGVMFALAIAGDIKEHHDAAAREEEIQKIIAESNGTKVRCPNPKCTRGRILWQTSETVREYPYSSDPWKMAQTTQEPRWHNDPCDRCDGKGWVYK